ncbi:hypothetical protein U1Q18_016052 [Sarracenia purpurea var. burkii]
MRENSANLRVFSSKTGVRWQLGTGFFRKRRGTGFQRLWVRRRCVGDMVMRSLVVADDFDTSNGFGEVRSKGPFREYEGFGDFDTVRFRFDARW